MELLPDRKFRVCAFGEILWDIIDGAGHLGGAPFNFAAHAARLGLSSTLVSRVGNDSLGTKAIEHARLAGVKINYIGVDSEYPTGTVDVTISRLGQPDYKIDFPAAWDFIQFQEPGSQRLFHDPVDAVYFGTLAQRNCVSRNGLKSLLSTLPAVPVIYDVNLRQDYYSKEIIEWGLHKATIVKMNDDEARTLSALLLDKELSEAEFASALRQKYELNIVLVTLGSNGCLVTDGHETNHLPGRSVKVVDTVGAGDAFSAAFLASWLHGVANCESAALANFIGSYVASQCGAIPEYSPEILDRLHGDYSLSR